MRGPEQSSKRQTFASGSIKSPKGDARRDEKPANDRQSVNNLVTNDFPIAQSKVVGILVSVLRDTSCNRIDVKRNLVCDKELTGEIGKLTLLDKSIIETPVAHITIHTPFYEDRVEALCLDNPIIDLVLGNIDGVRSPADPKSLNLEKQSAAVTTRVRVVSKLLQYNHSNSQKRANGQLLFESNFKKRKKRTSPSRSCDLLSQRK